MRSNELQGHESIQVGTADQVQRVAGKAAIRRQLVTTLLQATTVNTAKTRGRISEKADGDGYTDGIRLMTVREVAAALRICTATVYSMIERGELEHTRVSNAIRVVVRGCEA